MSNDKDERYTLTPKGIIFCNLMDIIPHEQALDLTETILENIRTYCLRIGIKNPAIVWENGSALFCNRD